MIESETNTTEKTTKKKRKGLIWILIILILVLAWFLVRPGVFTIQPIGAIPDGVTIVYYSRNPEMPFFSSPDGLCLEYLGYVNLICRAQGISAATELVDRELFRLPYIHSFYLLSTGGAEFEN